jgi:hypothetical protein
VDGTASDHVKWCAFPLAVLNVCVLLPESQLISKMDLMEIGCENGRWMELAQDRVQCWAAVLAVFKLCVLLPDIWLVSKSCCSIFVPVTQFFFLATSCVLRACC